MEGIFGYGATERGNKGRKDEIKAKDGEEAVEMAGQGYRMDPGGEKKMEGGEVLKVEGEEGSLLVL